MHRVITRGENQLTEDVVFEAGWSGGSTNASATGSFKGVREKAMAG